MKFLKSIFSFASVFIVSTILCRIINQRFSGKKSDKKLSKSNSLDFKNIQNVNVNRANLNKASYNMASELDKEILHWLHNK